MPSIKPIITYSFNESVHCYLIKSFQHKQKPNVCVQEFQHLVAMFQNVYLQSHIATEKGIKMLSVNEMVFRKVNNICSQVTSLCVTSFNFSFIT